MGVLATAAVFTGARRWGPSLAGLLIAMLAGLCLAPGTALANPTLTLANDGTISWVGAAADADSVTLFRDTSDGAYVFLDAGFFINVVDNSGGVLTATGAGTGQVNVLPGTGSATSIRLDDQGGGNAYVIQPTDPVTTLVPITIQNTLAVGGADDNINIIATVLSVPITMALTNAGVTVGTDVAPSAMVVNVDYTTTPKKAGLVVVGADGACTCSVDYSGNAGGLRHVSLFTQSTTGSPRNDQLTIANTAAGVPVSVHGFDGADRVVIGNGSSLAGIQAGVDLTMDQSGTFDLTVDGLADAAPKTVTLTSTSVTGLAPSAITFSGATGKFSLLTLKSGNGGNTITVSSTVQGPTPGTVNRFTAGSGSDTFVLPNNPTGTSVVAVDGGGGTDTLDFSGRTTSIDVNFETGTTNHAITFANIERAIGSPQGDTFTVGNTSVTVDGRAGSDTLTIDGTSAADTYGISTSGSDTLIAKTNATTSTVTATAIETITLNAGDGDDFIGVSLTQAGQTLHLNGGDGDDTITVGSGGSTKFIGGPVTVDGGGGSNNNVIVDDSLTATADQVTVTPSSVGAGGGDTLFGAGGSLTYQGVDILTIGTGSGSDTFTVTPAPVTIMALNGGNPAAAPGDALNIITTGLTSPGFTGTAANGTFLAAGRRPVTFQNFETLIADGGGVNGALALSAATYSVGEGGGSASIIISRSGFTVGSVGATLTPSNGTATAPGDFDASPIPVSLSAGQASVTVQVPIVNDSLPEPAKTVILTLSSPTGGATLDAQTTATLTIQDDDGMPSLFIGDAQVTEGNSGTSLLNFPVTLSPASSQQVTVHVATSDGTATVADGDYVSQSSTLTFDAGATSKTIAVVVSGDTRVESDETLTVTLTSPTNATIAAVQATGTILDDDNGPTIAIADAAVTEGNSGTTPATFIVTLNHASQQAVTVQYATGDASAAAGEDYQATTGTLTFPPGETSKTIAVLVTGDTTVEPDETFTVTLSNPVNATLAAARAIGTIRNDDLAVSVPPAPTQPCSPRPRIQATPAAGGGKLAVHIEATPLNTQQNNPILTLHFNQLQNARVTAGAKTFAAGQVVTLPTNTFATDFTVERVTPGQAVTVSFTVTDGCGSWPTFVGGGTAAGF